MENRENVVIRLTNIQLRKNGKHPPFGVHLNPGMGVFYFKALWGGLEHPAPRLTVSHLAIYIINAIPQRIRTFNQTDVGLVPGGLEMNSNYFVKTFFLIIPLRL